MSPALVMPYRKGNKTDRNGLPDAILEAVTRPSMRFVMVKSVAQRDLLLHRVRSPVGQEPHRPVQPRLRGLLPGAAWWCGQERRRQAQLAGGAGG